MAQAALSPTQLLALQFQLGGLIRALETYTEAGKPLPVTATVAVQYSLLEAEQALKRLVEQAGA